MSADVLSLLTLTLGALKMGTLPPQYVLKALITKVGRAGALITGAAMLYRRVRGEVGPHMTSNSKHHKHALERGTAGRVLHPLACMRRGGALGAARSPALPAAPLAPLSAWLVAAEEPVIAACSSARQQALPLCCRLHPAGSHGRVPKTKPTPQTRAPVRARQMLGYGIIVGSTLVKVPQVRRNAGHRAASSPPRPPAGSPGAP
jgi:hypothetical protein